MSTRCRCLLSGRAYEAGETVFVLEHVRWAPGETPSGAIDPAGRGLSDPLLDSVIHADDPNCRLSLDLMALIARRDIQAGEVISRDFRRACASRR